MIKVKKISKANIFLGVLLVISFIVAYALFSNSTSAFYIRSDILLNQHTIVRDFQINSTIILYVSISFWILCGFTIIAKIVLNIILAVTCSTSKLPYKDNQEMQMRLVLSENKLLAIFSIFFLSLILNIIIYSKTKHSLKIAKNIVSTQ